MVTNFLALFFLQILLRLVSYKINRKKNILKKYFKNKIKLSVWSLKYRKISTLKNLSLKF